MKFTCGKCQKEIEVERLIEYNQMALEDGWCEKCWYYEHWRPYKLWIGEKSFGIHGWAEIDPPDGCTIYYESTVEKDYKDSDWMGRPKLKVIPQRHEMRWMCPSPEELAKELSAEYKTTVLVIGERPEEKDTVFMIAHNGQLFIPVKKKEVGKSDDRNYS